MTPARSADRSHRREPVATTTGRPRWGHLASAWALLFAGLHLFWALGGSSLLASSAGVALAGDRPRWFVIFGLWGMALVLLAGAALGRTLAHGRPGGRATRMLAVVSCLVGAGLLLRGVGVELLLLTGAAGVARNVGQDQTRLSLLLWNPWFVVGGLTFALAGVQSRRDRA